MSSNGPIQSRERKKLENISWEYLVNNFHKFSEENKVRIALWMLSNKSKKPRVYRSIQSGWAKEVLTRDGFKCKSCGSAEKLQAHHIKSVKNFPELLDDINNGETLCFKCHKKTENYCGGSRINALL